MTYILHRTPCCRYTWEQKHGKNNNIPIETKLVCKYMVDTDNLNITLRTTYNNGNDFVSMEIDGRLLENNTMPVNYNFEKAGEHIVKYELKDNTILGYNAPCFYTPNLVEVIIPDGVTEIKLNVFNNCTNLTNVTIPSGVTTIGDGAFNSCTNLTSIVIPDSVTSIGNNAFVSCGITNIEIKNGHIGRLAFASCSYLTEVLIDDDVTEIGPVAFHYCTGLTNVSIGTGITSIGGSAFADCSGLTSLTIKATTPPTLGDSFVFLTPNCPIYVPSESVNTYKAAEYWSTYADRIQAIS